MWARSYVAWIALLLVARPAAAGVEDLRQLAPQGAGLYVELNDVKGNLQRIQESELNRRLSEFPPVNRWRQTAMPALWLIGAQISGQLSVPFDRLRDDVFGGSVLLAAWPERVDGQWQGTGLLLVDAPDAEMLAKAVAGLNNASRRSGELKKLETATHAGLEYKVRHLRRNGNDTAEYLAVFGRIGVLCNQEAVIHKVLELRAAGTKPAGSLSTDLRYNAALAKTSPEAALRVYLDPRPWQSMLKEALAKGVEDDPSGKPVAEFISKLYPAIDYWIVSAEARAGIVLETYLALDAAKLNVDLTNAIGAFSGRSKFLDQVPRDALVAYAGRAKFEWIARAVHALADESARRDMQGVAAVSKAVLGGWDLATDLFPALGPDVGGYVVPNPDAAEHVVPLAGIVGVRLEDRAAEGDKPSLHDAMRETLRTLWNFAAVANNIEHPNQPAVVKSGTRQDVPVTWAEGLSEIAPGMRPAFAIQGEFIWFGTSPEALARATQLSAAEALPAKEQLQLSDRVSTPSHIWFANLSAARDFVSQHRETLVTVLAKQKHVEPEKISKSLEQLEALLKLADHVVAAEQWSVEGLATAVHVVVKKEGLGAQD